MKGDPVTESPLGQSPLVCVDASFALAFALQDEPLHTQALALIGHLAAQNAQLCAPALFIYEADSVLRLRVWKGTLSEAEATEARAFIEALNIRIEYDPATRDRATDIARIYNQPRVYDASYAAHAEARGVELLTTDAPFFEAVNGTKKPRAAPPLVLVQLLK